MKVIQLITRPTIFYSLYGVVFAPHIPPTNNLEIKPRRERLFIANYKFTIADGTQLAKWPRILRIVYDEEVGDLIIFVERFDTKQI